MGQEGARGGAVGSDGSGEPGRRSRGTTSPFRHHGTTKSATYDISAHSWEGRIVGRLVVREPAMLVSRFSPHKEEVNEHL